MVVIEKGNKLITGSYDSTLRFWDLTTGLRIVEYDIQAPHQVNYIAVSESADMLFAACDGGAVGVWYGENNNSFPSQRCRT
jgi:WD40 repeat protein